MSQFPPPQQFVQPAPPGGSGMAIAALVCALIGFVVPLLGIVAVVLAILALVKPVAPGRGKGLPIAVLVVAIVATVFNCVGVMAGVMLPALGKARQTARQLKSSTQVRMAGIALHQYASVNKNWFPEVPNGLDRLVADGSLSQAMLVSPHADGQSVASYIYLPPSKPISQYDHPDRVVVVYENPEIVRGQINVLFMDGQVMPMNAESLKEFLSRQGASAAKPPASGRR